MFKDYMFFAERLFGIRLCNRVATKALTGKSTLTKASRTPSNGMPKKTMFILHVHFGIL
jgi:hypothetical protein